MSVRGGIIGGVVGGIGLLLLIAIIAVLILLALNASKKKQIKLSGILVYGVHNSYIVLELTLVVKKPQKLRFNDECQIISSHLYKPLIMLSMYNISTSLNHY